MGKWLAVQLVVVALLAAVGVRPAAAQPCPDPWQSTVKCECTADAQTGIGASSRLPFRCTISPSGRGPAEDIGVKVTVRNILGTPCAGSTVTVTAVAMGGAIFIWDDGMLPAGDTQEDPQSLLSDVQGRANFVHDEGGVKQATPTTFPNLNFLVTALSPGPWPPVTLHECSVDSDVLQVISYDEDATCDVLLPDFAIFTAAYLVTQDPEADFNWDGVVDLMDFAMFTSHYVAGADCDKQ